MTIEDQVELLLSLGRRLKNWSSPGDAEDYICRDESGRSIPLWNELVAKYMPPPQRVGDLILARFFRIKDFRSQKPIYFLLNAAQQMFSAQRTAANSICKAGRAGFTTYVSCWALLECMTNLGRTAVMVATDLNDAKEYFTQVQFTFNNLPAPFGEQLKIGALRTGGRGGRQNVREIYFPVLNSGFLVESAGDAAPAQGASIQHLVCDEVARWKKGDPKQVFIGLTSHVTGTDTEIDVLSRPYGSAGIFYENYQGAKAGTNGYSRHFFPWWMNAAQRKKPLEGFRLTDSEKLLQTRYAKWRDAVDEKFAGPERLLNSQITWRRDMLVEMKDLAGQEFAEDDESCFLGSGNCPFDSVALEIILRDATPLVRHQQGAGESENGLWVWREPQPGHRYVVFGDPATTLWTSRDAAQVFDLDTGEQVAEACYRIDAIGFAAILRDLATRYNSALLAVENNLGQVSVTVSNALAQAPAYGNLYWNPNSRQAELGWRTSQDTRPSMLSTLHDEIVRNPQNFHSRRLVAELKSMERDGDRIQARSKDLTDDLVMAAAGALEIRRQGFWTRKPWMVLVEPARETNLERTFIPVGQY